MDINSYLVETRTENILNASKFVNLENFEIFQNEISKWK